MAIVALEGMHFYAYHGVFKAEQENGNDFVVDLYMETSGALPTTDDLGDVPDYGKAYDIVAEIMATRVQLLETLVAKIGPAILERMEEVAGLRVRVSKMSPPVTGDVLRSYVEETYKR